MKIKQRSTAINTYHNISDSLPTRRMAVFQALKELKSACNLDIAYYINQPINRITPRTNELVGLGLVEEDCRKVTPRTGRRVIYWKVKENEPEQSKFL